MIVSEFDGLTKEQLQAMLPGVQKAYQSLVSGQAVAAFQDQNGERVQYSITRLDSLKAYLLRLQQAIRCYADPCAAMRDIAPLTFFF